MILDVGCGFRSGYGKRKRYSHTKRGTIGIDLHRGLCDVVADAHYLPFVSSVFRGCFAYSVLEHLENPIKALKEIRRTLKDGSFIEIIVPIDSKQRPLNEMINRFINIDLLGIYRCIVLSSNAMLHKCQFSKEGLKEILTKLDFKVLKFVYNPNPLITRFLLRDFSKKLVHYVNMTIYAQIVKPKRVEKT